MPVKSRATKITDAPLEDLLHDGSEEFDELVQSILNELNIEQDILNLRREAGLTQTELAKIAGVRQPFIAKLEKGRVKNIELKTLVRIATALGASVDVSVKKNPKICKLIHSPRPTSRPTARASVSR